MPDLSFLERERSLPNREGHGRVVQWHVFRAREQAAAFAAAIVLGDDQDLVGGYSRDSVGALWWVGVQVRDLSRWGNLRAINKHAG